MSSGGILPFPVVVGDLTATCNAIMGCRLLMYVSLYPYVETTNKQWRTEHAIKISLLEHPDNCKTSKTQSLGQTAALCSQRTSAGYQ